MGRSQKEKPSLLMLGKGDSPRGLTWMPQSPNSPWRISTAPTLGPEEETSTGRWSWSWKTKEGWREEGGKPRRQKKEHAKPSRLLAVAEQQEKQKKVRREKERKKGRGKRSSGVRALVRLLEKKETKKKSKGGGGPSESSSSPESSSYEDEESSSESDLKAPLQRKSAKSPGSVMKMLVHHCQEALDQSSAVAVEEKSAVTSGVKLVTYFNLLVRPHFPSTSRDMKEMYMLAVALDLLRCGKLQEVGDALASRFLAVHCAASEGNWSAAKFLEMYPLEVMQSAPTELLLKARKHHRLIQKSQGVEQNSWTPRFNPGGNWKGGGKDEEKGKGKGKKGKGRGQQQYWQKDSWNQWQNRRYWPCIW